VVKKVRAHGKIVSVYSLADTNAQIQAAEKELADMMGDLTTTDLKKAKDLQDLLHLFQ
jgi:type I restriction enzyme M protein